MFLSSSKVRTLIERGDLKFEHAYVPVDSGYVRAPKGAADLSDPTSASAKLLLSNLSGTRLQLTVGPLARSHHDFAYAGRVKFRDAEDIVDIAGTGLMTVEPRETLTILTNEYVEFSDQYAGIVTPRVTMTDAGFLLTTAYIDPGYKGLLRVTLHNATDRRQTLKLCEPIAQLFIYKVSGDVDPDNSARLVARSVFYGSNWTRVLDEHGDAFPRRKLPTPQQPPLGVLVNVWRSAKRSSSSIVKAIVACGLVGLLVAGLVGYGSFQEKLKSFDELESQVSAVQAAAPRTGVTTLNFRDGIAEVSLPLSGDVPEDAVVLSEIRGAGAEVVSAKLEEVGGRIRLNVSATLDNGADGSAEFVWAVLP